MSGSRQGQSHGQKKLTGSSISHSVAATNTSTRHGNKSGLMLMTALGFSSATYLHLHCFRTFRLLLDVFRLHRRLQVLFFFNKQKWRMGNKHNTTDTKSAANVSVVKDNIPPNIKYIKVVFYRDKRRRKKRTPTVALTSEKYREKRGIVKSPPPEGEFSLLRL